jgi:hypothetical protein
MLAVFKSHYINLEHLSEESNYSKEALLLKKPKKPGFFVITCNNNNDFGYKPSFYPKKP